MNPFPLTLDWVKRDNGEFLRISAPVALALCLLSPNLEAIGMEAWWPVDAGQLQEQASTLSPGAAAEVLDWKIEEDDSQLPLQSDYHEYIRYKIFDPERAANITRVSETMASYDGTSLVDMTLRARLILPDGTRKEFGKESIQERDLQRNGSEKSWVTRLFGSSG